MKKNRIAAILGAAALMILSVQFSFAASFPDPPAETAVTKSATAQAVFAGGCFWGMEGVFERLKGVSKVLSGYSGGQANTAQYETVSSGTTGHAETVQIFYDPSVITFGTLLKVYFSVAHDPTQLNYQGPDHGTQYRSVIFYQNDFQKQIAQEYIQKLNAAKIFPSAIVTQLTAFKAFYPAEGYHQHFLDKNPDYPYIVYWDLPKIENLKRIYPNLVNTKYQFNG